VAAMFINGWELNAHSLKMTFQGCFLPSFDSFGSGFREEDFFRNQPIRNENCLWWPCLLMDRDKINNIYGEPSIHASYQVSVHLAKWFQSRFFFLEISQSETIACGRHVCFRIGTK
jgi:hypothetical protein